MSKTVICSLLRTTIAHTASPLVLVYKYPRMVASSFSKAQDLESDSP
jgi:hypothetical protein